MHQELHVRRNSPKHASLSRFIKTSTEVNTKLLACFVVTIATLASSLLVLEAAEFANLIYVWLVLFPASVSTPEEGALVLALSCGAIAATLPLALLAFISLTVKRLWPGLKTITAVAATSSLAHLALLNAGQLFVSGHSIRHYLDGQRFTLLAGLLSTLVLVAVVGPAAMLQSRRQSKGSKPMRRVD